jgi:hypothetical protein
MGIPLKKVAKRWMQEPGFKEGYDALEEEFSLASQLIEARARAGPHASVRSPTAWGPANRPWLAWRAAAPSPAYRR